MGYYKYMKTVYDTKEHEDLMRQRVISWNKEPVFVKMEHPTKLDRAHTLGFKAKQGFSIVRVRIGKGGSKREKPAGGRKPLRSGMTKITPNMNLQHISEMRVAKKFPNLEVLNSYYVAESGKDIWFEVILVDPQHPCIKSDKQVKWICEQRGRVFRGLTSAGKSSRNL
ncbi:MAG: 50S ribosomal protein L15e [Candidatus Aenigmarchaeota archaeon]|nr:50S ribosomal protein L15e [Candidatus Aenigmarchaeota archaeon]